MKTLEKLSENAIEFCELSGYDVEKVKESMKSSAFSFNECETKEECDEEGVDYNYPYTIYNPFNFDIKKRD